MWIVCTALLAVPSHHRDKACCQCRSERCSTIKPWDIHSLVRHSEARLSDARLSDARLSDARLSDARLSDARRATAWK
ncbi:pentapeptide repeat-containing protein [Novipirellula herctigrandis]|uniref:pentapeptide repeat-containing protein n=1 Tax=Novipirellula herctigrandis TaxID=2527986 RepID=UPI003AF3317E